MQLTTTATTLRRLHRLALLSNSHRLCTCNQEVRWACLMHWYGGCTCEHDLSCSTSRAGEFRAIRFGKILPRECYPSYCLLASCNLPACLPPYLLPCEVLRSSRLTCACPSSSPGRGRSTWLVLHAAVCSFTSVHEQAAVALKQLLPGLVPSVLTGGAMYAFFACCRFHSHSYWPQ